ncbi:MAG: glycosyltransferase family 2 protein [Gallionella sp.]|jgi:GT2 family glycosyltransferase
MVSIIIPTFNHLEDALKPCLKTVFKYTTFADTEVIIVANGCTDGTEAYIQSIIDNGYGKQVKLLSFPKPLGFAKAVNAGLKASKGDYIVFLNNDTELLPQEQNAWIDMLRKPFKEDPKMGVTGVIRHWEVGLEFIIFFCAMTSREVFKKVGLLDESFGIGAMEDVDFCTRARLLGYKFRQVPDDKSHYWPTKFPIIHRAESTVHHLDIGREGWEAHFKGNQDKLAEKYSELMNTVTATISTKDRYFTTLPLAIFAIANQTHKVDKLIIFDDGEHKDIREIPLYKNLIGLIEKKGIQWAVVWGERKGQVANHQKALELAKTEWIWRLDDDNAPEPDCLEKLLKVADKKTGAVGGLVPFSTMSTNPVKIASNKIEDIYLGLNKQWFRHEGVSEVDHLYSTFIFRKRAGQHGYCKELSKVGHREETIFTYEMKRAGWKLLLNPEAVTWHFREATGGIRSETDHGFWDFDEKVFRWKMDKEWMIKPTPVKLIVLNNGLGDHITFHEILPEIREKFKGNKMIISCCYTDIFKNDKDVELISIGEAQAMTNIEQFNIYKWMWDRNWNKSIIEAYRGMYL